MNNQITTFSRFAGYTVNKALSPENRVKSVDKAQLLINNMNLINQALLNMAVKVMHKAKKQNDVDVEELSLNLQDIIHLSVVSYAKRAH